MMEELLFMVIFISSSILTFTENNKSFIKSISITIVFSIISLMVIEIIFGVFE